MFDKKNEVKDFDNCTETDLITSPEIDNQVKLLFPNTDGLKIGISWKDFDLIKSSSKYLSNSDVSKIIEFGNNTFINLQFGDVSNDLIQINKYHNAEEVLDVVLLFVIGCFPGFICAFVAGQKQCDYYNIIIAVLLNIRITINQQ